MVSETLESIYTFCPSIAMVSETLGSVYTFCPPVAMVSETVGSVYTFCPLCSDGEGNIRVCLHFMSFM